MKYLELTIPGKPVPWARSRTNRGHHFTAKKPAGGRSIASSANCSSIFLPFLAQDSGADKPGVVTKGRLDNS